MDGTLGKMATHKDTYMTRTKHLGRAEHNKRRKERAQVPPLGLLKHAKEVDSGVKVR